MGDCTLGSGANVTVSGKVTFDLVPHDVLGALDYSNIIETSSKGVTVEAVCNTLVAATTSTDNNGDYSLQIPGDSSNVYIRVKAEMKKSGSAPTWDFTAVDNTRSQALYSMSGAKFNSGTQDSVRDLRADSGWTGSSYGSARVAAPFTILNSVYKAQQNILSMNALTVFPALIINWSTDNIAVEGNIAIGQITTSFYSNSQIFLLGEEDSDTDEYDEHVIIHEWAHYFENHFSRTDSIGGRHGAGDRLDMRVAFSEGFSNAYSVIAGDGDVYFDALGGSQSSGFRIDLENNNCGANVGWYSECSIQSIIYDLFDAPADGVDMVGLGFKPIYDVLVGEQKDTVALTSVFSFIQPLKVENAPESSDIDALVSGQNIFLITDVFGSNETNDAGNPNDVLPVYTNITAGQTISALCVIDDFIEFIASDNEFYNVNKLSSHRFIKFIAPNTQSYTITVNKNSGSGNDPDIVLYQGVNGVMDFSLGTQAATETLTANLIAGLTYIIQINDKDVTNSTALIGKTCFDVIMSN